MSSSEFFTVKEIAKLLKVSERTIYTWIEFGYLRAIKIPSQKGSIRILKKDLDEFVRMYETVDENIPAKRKLKCNTHR